MTGRTHDLAAFAALSSVMAFYPLPHLSLATAVVGFAANMIGGLAPDIDQSSSSLWHDLPAGNIIGKIFTPFLGGHRNISHSLLGIILFGIGAKFILTAIGKVLLVNMSLVWLAFMIGFISHLIMDSLTREGVPWLFPFPIKFGIPPVKSLRIKTGGFMEKLIVFPGLIALTGYIFYSNYNKFLSFFRHLL